MITVFRARILILAALLLAATPAAWVVGATAQAAQAAQFDNLSITPAG